MFFCVVVHHGLGVYDAVSIFEREKGFVVVSAIFDRSDGSCFIWFKKAIPAAFDAG